MSDMVLTTEGELLLTCIRTYCDCSVDEQLHSLMESRVDWAQVMFLASRHNLMPVVASRLTHAEFKDGIPQSVFGYMKEILYSSVRYDVEYRQWMSQVLKLLASLDITPLMLKGPAISDRLYPASYLRPSGDLDLMVKPQDVVRAGRALIDAGYAVEHHLPAAVDELHGMDLSPLNTGGIEIASPAFSRRHDYHISLRRSDGNMPKLVELHWKPAPARSFVAQLHEIWESAVPFRTDGSDVLVLSPEHQVTMLIFHMINHGWQDGSLRKLLDLSLLLSKVSEIDWDEVVHLVRRQGARGHAYHVLSWTGDHMGAPVPDGVISRLMPGAYELWSSRPFSKFEEMVLLKSPQGWRGELGDIVEGVSKQESFSDRARFLLGVFFPPMSGLSQMRGEAPDRRLYLAYLLRPFVVVQRMITGILRRRGSGKEGPSETNNHAVIQP